jgi:hypothetical protein
MFKDLKKEFPSTLLLLVILILGSFYFFADYMDVFPSYIHAWTQSDRLALAMRFQENGFDFFHPSTYNLLTKDGITQVDFPVHDYLVALFSSIFSRDIVASFRWYNLIYSLIGWIFLFRFCLKIKLSPARAIFATLFFFTLPFLVYYQNGFLPSMPSLANFFIALYFLTKYLQKPKWQSLYLSVFFLLIAALARIPFSIFLFALWIVLFYSIIKKKTKFSHLIPSSISLLVVIAYWLYNQRIGEIYGSMFLTETMHFYSIENFTDVLFRAAKNWGKELLSPFHWIILFLFIAVYFAKSKVNLQLSKWSFFEKYIAISAIGVLIYFFLLGNQFADHDYYYIDSFIPLLVLIFTLLLGGIKIPSKWYPFIGFTSILFTFYFFSFSKSIIDTRYTPPFYDRIEYAYEAYKNVNPLLESWGVAKEDTLIVLDANSTNIPFTVWKRRGYTSLGSGKEVVDETLENKHDYVFMLDSFFRSDGYQDYPELINRLELLNTNGEISQYALSENSNASKFFKNLIHEAYSDFDSKITLDSSAMAWVQTKEDTTAFNKSMLLKADQLYMLTTTAKVENLIENKDVEVSILADYKTIDSVAKVQLVVSTESYYGTAYLENQITKPNQWQNQLYRIIIPHKRIKNGETIKVYFWNPEKDNLLIDNYHLLIMQ